MTSFTIELNENTKAGKTFVAFMETFLKGKKGIRITESPYNAEFVKKIKAADKRADFTTINANDIWGSLNLK